MVTVKSLFINGGCKLQRAPHVRIIVSACGNMFTGITFFKILNSLSLFIARPTCIPTLAISFVFFYSAALICALTLSPGGTNSLQ